VGAWTWSTRSTSTRSRRIRTSPERVSPSGERSTAQCNTRPVRYEVPARTSKGVAEDWRRSGNVWIAFEPPS
jgi:hypothetical protein